MKSCTSLTLNQKLDMIKFSEETMSKTRPLVPVSQEVNTKEKFLNEMRSATLLDTNDKSETALLLT